MNRVNIIGNLGQDPKLEYTQAGKAVCTLSVAVEEYNPNSPNCRETTWFKIKAWGKLGENCSRFLRKGSKIGVDGKMKSVKWTDQQNQKRETWQIWADSVDFLDPKPSNPYVASDGQANDSSWEPQAEGQALQNTKPATELDHLPF